MAPDCKAVRLDVRFSIPTGTVFQGPSKCSASHLGFWSSLRCARARTVSLPREIEREHGVCPRKTPSMMHRIREAMKTDAIVTLCSMKGIIIADETYIGGIPGTATARPSMPASTAGTPTRRRSFRSSTR